MFRAINDLKNISLLENDQEPWFSMTMKLTFEGNLKIEYDYTKWGKSDLSLQIGWSKRRVNT
ncbi:MULTISPECIES: immunity protein YezG family protein [Paenibacillus]|uniref:immunity protein YezG family protein n=1 Tax=Paenibacillus TaxID=44249 RepID=UPI00333FCC08